MLRRADAARWRPAALVVRGAATLLSDEGSQAVEILREALRLDPDGAAPKATLRAALRVVKRRKEARDLATKRSFADAAAAYDRLLADDLAGAGAALDGFPALAVLAARSPLYARCRAERGTCRLRTGDADAALKDCAAALYVVDDLVDAHLCRANALRALGRHAEARKHLKDIIDESWGGSDVRVKHAFEQADFRPASNEAPRLLRVAELSPSVLGAGNQGRLPRSVVTTSSGPPLYSIARGPAKRGRGLQAAKGRRWTSWATPKRELYDKGFDKEAIHAKLEAAKRASQNLSAATAAAVAAADCASLFFIISSVRSRLPVEPTRANQNGFYSAKLARPAPSVVDAV